MVATRRGANKAAEVAPVPASTLNAPPKRGGGRKKAAVEDVVEPASAVEKPVKTTSAAKRKAKAEPEAADIPVAKKTTASRTTRTAKVEPMPEPAASAPKRATRGRKAQDAPPAEQPEAVQDAPKPATARTRKAPTKKAVVPPSDAPADVGESAIDDTAKPVSRARRAPAKKAVETDQMEIPAVQENSTFEEPAKPAARARKAAAPKMAPAPTIAARPTRGRNTVPAPQPSPLKAPARKPVKALKKSSATISATETQPTGTDDHVAEAMDEGLTGLPDYPTTPVHIAAPLTSRRAIAELPNWPDTPAHIKAPISSKDALAALPDYPRTPAHIKAPVGTMAALAEMPEYPETPAHITAPVTAKEAIAEMPGYPKTPAHIIAPLANKEALKELPGYPQTPAHVKAPLTSKEALVELPGYPNTPAHVVAPTDIHEASSESPALVVGTMDMEASSLDSELEHANAASPTRTVEADGEVTSHAALNCDESTMPKAASPVASPAMQDPISTAHTPVHSSPSIVNTSFCTGCDDVVPTHIVWGVTNQEAFQELPVAYPVTPAHVAAPITTKDALAELPDYPKTPLHIPAPMTPRQALAELPSYPTTPAIDLEIAIQAEITASVKKQTPSPLKFSSLEDVSFQFAENSEITDLDFTEVHDDDTQHAPIPLSKPMSSTLLQLTARMPMPEPSSPKKSALRSPLKTDAKTPKKAVTWDDPEESELFLHDGPLQGMTFFVDVTRNGVDQNHLFSGLLEDLGAKVVKDWNSCTVSHVLFKDGSKTTLEKVVASRGTIKCVNVGWVLDSEKNRMRMAEGAYLVDLSAISHASPAQTATSKLFTPARTPSRYALPPSSECRSVPATPTSSEFDRSINFDEKENQEHGIFFDGPDKMEVRTVPQKKSSFLFGRSPIKTPSKPSFLLHTPLKAQTAAKPFSTTKKRTLADSTFGGLSVGPPKKLRLF